jgi:hypothetical protein
MNSACNTAPDAMEVILDNRKDGRSIALKGDKGAVEFYWYKPMEGWEHHFSGGIECHSKNPRSQNDRSLQEWNKEHCEKKGIPYDRSKDDCILTGGECYCDGTSLGAINFAESYGIKPSDTIDSLEKRDMIIHIVRMLKGYYHSWFNEDYEDE